MERCRATIVTELQASRFSGDDALLTAANAGLIAFRSAALPTVDAMATDVVRIWAATAAAGSITGLTAGKDAAPQIRAIAGCLVKAQIPIYRLDRDRYGNGSPFPWVVPHPCA